MRTRLDMVESTNSSTAAALLAALQDEDEQIDSSLRPRSDVLVFTFLLNVANPFLLHVEIDHLKDKLD